MRTRAPCLRTTPRAEAPSASARNTRTRTTVSARELPNGSPNVIARVWIDDPERSVELEPHIIRRIVEAEVEGGSVANLKTAGRLAASYVSARPPRIESRNAWIRRGRCIPVDRDRVVE